MTVDQMASLAENAIAAGHRTTQAVADLLGVAAHNEQLYVALEGLRRAGRIRTGDGGWERTGGTP